MKFLEIKPELILKPNQLTTYYSIVQGLIDDFPEQIPTILISEFAELHRELPLGTPYPGPWRNWRTPYAVEIMDSLSARSLTQEVIWIKCSQIGATAIVENFLAYIIKMVPGPAMYVSAKEDLLRKWVNKRLYPLLISCGLENYIGPQHVMKGQRRTGNQMFAKEFPGGSLDMVSAESESNLRMDTVRYLVLDEAGKYPWDVQGFGDPIAIARARTANWRSRKKIFIPSTPGLEGECRMWELYQEGDQRRYFVACPHCGANQVLRFPSEPSEFYEGFVSAQIKWETKAGQLDKKSIHFDCDKCKEQFFERHKLNMVINGQWRPTAKSTSPFKRSYQIGRLYSMMDDWERLVRDEIESVDNPLKLQTHHNHACGIPYRETSVTIDKKKVYELRGGYKSGVIPSDKVLFVTVAVDVQLGKDNDPNKPARLEMEVCGHGYGYRTWSLLYKVFKGSVDDAYDGAWEDLYQFINNGSLEFARSDGFIFLPAVGFIDSHTNETVVFDFCSRVRGFYPVKGARDLKETAKGGKVSHRLDEPHNRDIDRFRVNNKNGSQYIMVSTNWYKRRLYRAINVSVKRKGQNATGNMYCDFPTDYPDTYFDALVAEEERADHTFWLPSGRANEALDLRVYNICAGEFWLYTKVQFMVKEARRNGVPSYITDQYNSRNILKSLERDTARKDATPAAVPPSRLV